MEQILKNPWKKIDSTIIYKNKWITLREDKVRTPSGGNGIYSVVEAQPAIGIVPFYENMDTVLVGQYRYALNSYSWEIPEGGGANGETNLETAKRELMEETGLRASKWTYLDSLFTSNCFTNEVGHVYLAENLEEGLPDPEHTEDLQTKRLPFIKAFEMVLNYEIKDALAIIGIMRVYHYLKKQGKI